MVLKKEVVMTDYMAEGYKLMAEGREEWLQGTFELMQILSKVRKQCGITIAALANGSEVTVMVKIVYPVRTVWLC
jgi:hypothetical protein